MGEVTVSRAMRLVAATRDTCSVFGSGTVAMIRATAASSSSIGLKELSVHRRLIVLGADGSGSHSLQPHHENADIRRRNSRDTRCLTEGGGANLRELLPCFKSQTGNGREIERAWDLFVFERLE